MMKYPLGYACGINDMLINFRKDYFTVTLKQCKEHTGDPSKRNLIKQIFKYCILLVVEDIVNRNVTFWLPLNGIRAANMHMIMFEGELFKTLKRKRKWKNLDFLKSNFKGYQIGLYLLGRRIPLVKKVYVSARYRDLIDENANNGMPYGDGKIDTKLNDYLPTIYAKYPWIPKKDLKKTLTFLWRLLFLLNTRGCDVQVKFPDFWFYTGTMYVDGLQITEYYRRKLVQRIRILDSLKREPWDGYYYFIIGESLYLDYLSLIAKTGRPRKHFTFKHIYMCLLKEEAYIKSLGKSYLFRIPYITKFGPTHYYNELKTDKAEFLGKVQNLKLEDILISNKKYRHI